MLLPPLPVLPITSPETLTKCRTLSLVGPKDVFIASFPKSGTTWMQNIVVQLLLASNAVKVRSTNTTTGSSAPAEDDDDDDKPSTTRSRSMVSFPELSEHISNYAPFFEIDAHWEESANNKNISSTDHSTDGIFHSKFQPYQEELGGYRVFNTHLYYDMLPKSADPGQCHHDGKRRSCNYIYVVRDGRDVMTSFFHHLSNQHLDDGGFEGTFDEFLQDHYFQGKLPYGKWGHHLASWMPEIVPDGGTRNGNIGQNHPSSILLVQYEHLKTDLRGQIERIGQFLQLLSSNDDETTSSTSTANTNSMAGNAQILDHVLERVSFSYMRRHQELFHPISVRWKPGYNFIRSGQVGGHKALFTKEQRQAFVEDTLQDIRNLYDPSRSSSSVNETHLTDKSTLSGDDVVVEDIPSWLFTVGFVNDKVD